MEGVMRVSIKNIPIKPTPCPMECVYRQQGICDEPRINKGNSDATCNAMNNKDLLEILKGTKNE